MMNKPALHHFLDHFSSKVRNKELAEGLAAAAALLAVGRGVPGQEDKKHFEEGLRHADLLRHLDLDHCLYRYDEYVSNFLENGEAGEKRVLENLREAREFVMEQTLFATLQKDNAASVDCRKKKSRQR